MLEKEKVTSVRGNLVLEGLAVLGQKRYYYYSSINTSITTDTVRAKKASCCAVNAADTADIACPRFQDGVHGPTRMSAMFLRFVQRSTY